MNTKFVEEAESFLEQHPEIGEFDFVASGHERCVQRETDST